MSKSIKLGLLTLFTVSSMIGIAPKTHALISQNKDKLLANNSTDKLLIADSACRNISGCLRIDKSYIRGRGNASGGGSGHAPVCFKRKNGRQVCTNNGNNRNNNNSRRSRSRNVVRQPGTCRTKRVSYKGIPHLLTACSNGFARNYRNSACINRRVYEKGRQYYVTMCRVR